MRNPPSPRPDEFKLSRAGWEIYHQPRRYPRANYPVQEPELMTKAEYAAEAAGLKTAVKQGESTMRGVKRLVNLAEQLMKEADTEADAAANDLVAAHGEVKTAIGEVKDHVVEVKKVAADVRDQLRQITNGPTEGSQG